MAQRLILSQPAQEAILKIVNDGEIAEVKEERGGLVVVRISRRVIVKEETTRPAK